MNEKVMDSGNNPVIHFEIGCTDQANTADFYEACFDWKISRSDNMATVDTQNKNGIDGFITSLVTEIDNYVLFYIQVKDVSKTLHAINKAGGKTRVPPVELPDGRTFAWFEDVAGNTLGLITKLN